MKSLTRITLFAVVLVMAATGCRKVKQTTIYTANVPVYMSYESLRTSIVNDNDRVLEKPGKIFLYGDWIMINDFESGIHLYDNTNPANPVHKAFVNVPGNVDMAVRDNILYVDSYVDLVAIDISDPEGVREVGRVPDALSYTIPSTMDWTYPVSNVDPTKGVVTGYQVAEVREDCKDEDCYGYYRSAWDEDWNGTWNGSMMSDAGSPVSFSGTTNNVRSSASSSQSGIAGSMARFMLIDTYLYVIVDETTVNIYDISTNNMNYVNSFSPWNDAGGWGMIETLFTFKEHLFIGSNNGMVAYNVSSPDNPSYLSSYSHMTSCDPVVANDDYAFVTLRAGNTCNWANDNQLDILDIDDIMQPRLIKTWPMTNPHGLSIDSESELLFLCDGTDGLKIYDFSVIGETGANRLDHITGMETYDVITHRSIAHVISRDGLYQYQYSPEGEMTELSRIELGD
ncbi:MAG: hypothetical protein GWP27_06815 [Bacteroidetes bacterium]|nr:hypothetical protein [Bacteroidota bacterium]